ncbi:NAD(P)-dependent oxidoreductase [Vibrio kyushuensis]|uniref:SDR family oxidoreductase n=1 Tax=Vibrio kyushuensis TaxID=2910249 RepID=UPI003D12C3BF
MRIGVTGSTGMLGSEVVKAISSSGYEPLSLTRSKLSNHTSLEEVVKLLSTLNLKVLIHCAANTNVEFCEEQPESCWIENSLFSEILATATEKLGIKLVFISSTGLYGDWKATPYIEYDKVSPTTVHHKSKYSAENFIKSHNKDYLIIRTGWLFGGNWQSKKNFVANRIVEAKASDGIIYSNATQVGNPTYALDVASTIVELITLEYVGLFNCVSEGTASRHEYVAEILRIAQIDVKVLPAEKNTFNRLAKVSDNESATNFKLNALGIGTIRSWQDGLKKYLLERNLLK